MKNRQYHIEGVRLDIPLHYDELTGKEIEIFPDYIKNPVYTPQGCPILFTGEDACAYGEGAQGTPCADCGSCVHFIQPPDSLLGVCHNEKMRSGAAKPGAEKEEIR